MVIPTPEPGLVINYTYLWHHEYEVGRAEGRDSDGATVVIVLPVTHTPPADAATAVEIPPTVKRHLGLDDARSWIVVAEGNKFVWPGYDLCKVPNSERFEYGFLPPRLFEKVRDAFVANYRAGKARTAAR